MKSNNIWAIRVLLAVALCVSGGVAFAGQLSVEPILLELNAPSASGALYLRSDEDAPVTVQTRVERWVQVDGVEKLVPTTDVVSSPPIFKLMPNTKYFVRIVRVSKRPVRGEESYRVLVDQLPSNPRESAPKINILIRQSIPVFFRAQRLNPPNVTWSLSREGKALFLNATNAGDERLRIASLRLQDASGRTISFGNGLVGYVLGRSLMKWQLPPHAHDFGAGGPVSIFAQTDRGPLRAATR
jgi:fimbrial chaperone protein